MGNKGGPDTKTNWPTDGRSQNNLNLNLNLKLCVCVCVCVCPSAWDYNWATLFLGAINTRTWPSRLEESQI
jgi:hypothetical protein